MSGAEVAVTQEARTLRCDYGRIKGVDKWPDVCPCSHAVTSYTSESGERCRCCLGLLGPGVDGES